MNRLDKLAINTKIKAAAFKENIKESLTSKKMGDSQIVVALILIVVAVGLAIIFRNQINEIIKNVANYIQNTVNQLGDGTVNPYTPVPDGHK